MLARNCSHRLIALFAVLTAAAAPAQRKTAAVDVSVDPRVELMSVIFRLAGNPEYNKARVPAYAGAVDAHFAAFRDHAVVRRARRLRASCGVSYDAVMSMAIHVADAKALKELVPFDPHPEALDTRWRLEDARAFLDDARAFVREAKFAKFFAAQRKTYATAVERMEKLLDAHLKQTWFCEFFGERPGATFRLVLGMLNGGACYGPRVRARNTHETLYCILGVWKVDPDGAPDFDASMMPTIAHEYCHSYCNPIVDRHLEALLPIGERVFPGVAEQMKRQAYGNPTTFLYESLVRASVVRYVSASEGDAAARKQGADDQARGFHWVPGLAERLAEYEAQRARYKTLDAFVPKIVDYLNKAAGDAEKQAERAPQVLRTIPVIGAKDVDPDLDKVVIVFDRKMADGSWAFVGGGPKMIQSTGKPSYDASLTTLTLPVKLEAGKDYEFWLNRGRFNSFRSADGTPLASVHFTFRTRAR